MIKHTIKAFYNKDSTILILGSFPSVKSRETGFYYGHPQNRFWRVLSSVFLSATPTTIEEKKEFLTRNKIALFDCIAECNIKGSSDTSIKDVIPNDLTLILKNSNIKSIYVNGKLAYNLYNKFIKNKTNIEAIYLPSTSPANANFKLEDLIKAYKVLNKWLVKVKNA